MAVLTVKEKLAAMRAKRFGADTNTTTTTTVSNVSTTALPADSTKTPPKKGTPATPLSSPSPSRSLRRRLRHDSRANRLLWRQKELSRARKQAVRTVMDSDNYLYMTAKVPDEEKVVLMIKKEDPENGSAVEDDLGEKGDQGIDETGGDGQGGDDDDDDDERGEEEEGDGEDYEELALRNARQEELFKSDDDDDDDDDDCDTGAADYVYDEQSKDVDAIADTGDAEENSKGIDTNDESSKDIDTVEESCKDVDTIDGSIKDIAAIDESIKDIDIVEDNSKDVDNAEHGRKLVGTKGITSQQNEDDKEILDNVKVDDKLSTKEKEGEKESDVVQSSENDLNKGESTSNGYSLHEVAEKNGSSSQARPPISDSMPEPESLEEEVSEYKDRSKSDRIEEYTSGIGVSREISYGDEHGTSDDVEMTAVAGSSDDPCPPAPVDDGDEAANHGSSDDGRMTAVAGSSDDGGVTAIYGSSDDRHTSGPIDDAVDAVDNKDEKFGLKKKDVASNYLEAMFRRDDSRSKVIDDEILADGEKEYSDEHEVKREQQRLLWKARQKFKSQIHESNDDSLCHLDLFGDRDSEIDKSTNNNLRKQIESACRPAAKAKIPVEKKANCKNDEVDKKGSSKRFGTHMLKKNNSDKDNEVNKNKRNADEIADELPDWIRQKASLERRQQKRQRSVAVSDWTHTGNGNKAQCKKNNRVQKSNAVTLTSLGSSHTIRKNRSVGIPAVPKRNRPSSNLPPNRNVGVGAGRLRQVGRSKKAPTSFKGLLSLLDQKATKEDV